MSLEFGGGNYILITVTGWDGISTQNYSIRVNRPQSTDNTLSDLTVNDVSIAGFTPAVKVYSLNVDYGVSSVTIKPTANDTYSRVWVDDTEITEPNLSVSVSLTTGSSKTITIKVRPQAGTDAIYTLTLTRAGSSKLSGLELSAGGVPLSLNADFNTDVLNYSVSESLANSVDTIKVKPMADPSASVTVSCIGGAAITPNQGEYTISLAAGSNEISIALTALNATARTYKVTVNRLKSSNANLSVLVVGGRSISLSKDVTSYSVNVANLPAAITLRPTAEDSTATVKVDGQTVVSGAESGPISLAVDNNTVTVEITAQDGTVKVYTITIIRAASDNAYLSGLTAEHNSTSLSLNYPFTKEDYTYSLSNVDNSVDSITIKPVRDEANSVLTVSCNGGDPISVGSDGKYTIGLAVGSNSITVKVTAQNGSVIKTYTLSVTRLKSGDANLSGLSVLEGAEYLTLSPTFSSSTATYSVTKTVPNSTGSISVVPQRADPSSTVSVSCSGGTVSESGGAYTVNLAAGSNTITVVVTAQNGNEKTYTVNVSRAGSSNADLSGLYIDNQIIYPTTEISYILDPVANIVSSISVKAVLADNNAAITSLSCNGNAADYNSGTDEYTAELRPGDNSISITVRAQDGAVKIYTVYVKRKYDLSLSSLVLRNSDNNAAIAMTASGDSYDAGTLNYSIAGVTVTPTAAEAAAAITVGGKVVTSGTVSETIALSVGQNTIEVKVEAGGDLRTYTITVNRAAASDNAYLKALTVDYGLWQLSPGFSKSETEYSLTVGSATKSIYIEYEAEEEHAAVSVNGVEMGTYVGWAAVNLSEVTDDKIPIVITAQDGTVKNIYQLTVIRVPEYSNAQLSGLTLELYNCYDGGNYVINPDTQLIPTEYPQLYGFYKEYYDYDVLWSGDYVKINPVANDGQSIEVSWFDAAGLEHEATEYISTKTLKTIIIKVTAKDGVSVKEYTLDFNASYLTELQVYTAVESESGYTADSPLHLSQPFSISVMEYMVNISDTGSAEAIIIGATADNEEAKVFVGNILLDDLYPYSLPFIIAEIDEDIPIVVTVEFGSDSYKITKTYTLTFYRDP